jgi:hypothetical protein
LRVKPFLHVLDHDVFATRAPARPSPIGLVRLLAIEGLVLDVDGIDVLDGTTLPDTKPYAARYGALENPRGGWTHTVDEATARERGRRGYPASTAHLSQSGFRGRYRVQQAGRRAFVFIRSTPQRNARRQRERPPPAEFRYWQCTETCRRRTPVLRTGAPSFRQHNHLNRSGTARCPAG